MNASQRFVGRFLALAALALFAVSAQAADGTATPAPTTHASGQPQCPMCSASQSATPSNPQAATLMHYHMMLRAGIPSNDPAALLGLKSVLNLTDEQVVRLQAILDAARAGAEGVLNKDQKTQLVALGTPPAGGMGMHHMMHGQGGQMMMQQH